MLAVSLTDSLDVFDSQQILKSAKQGMDYLDMHEFRGMGLLHAAVRTL